MRAKQEMNKYEEKLKKKSERNTLTINNVMKYDWEFVSKKPYTYIATSNRSKKKWLVKRKGVCDYKKCGNICCKFRHHDYEKGASGYTFHLNFGDPGKHGGITFPGVCKQLAPKSGKCKVWGDNMPAACKDFPAPMDQHYWEVFDECSFRFEKIYEIKDLK